MSMGTPQWTAYDDGYLQAYQWASALAGGAALPAADAPVPLGPGETSHLRLAPVTVVGTPTTDDLAACTELGAAISAGLVL